MYQPEHDPMESMMVDVGTYGIDRGEDDYVPVNEYAPDDVEDDVDEVDPQ